MMLPLNLFYAQATYSPKTEGLGWFFYKVLHQTEKFFKQEKHLNVYLEPKLITKSRLLIERTGEIPKRK